MGLTLRGMQHLQCLTGARWSCSSFSLPSIRHFVGRLFMHSCCVGWFWLPELWISLFEVNQHCTWTNNTGSGYLLKAWDHTCLILCFIIYQSKVDNQPRSTSDMAKVTRGLNRITAVHHLLCQPIAVLLETTLPCISKCTGALLYLVPHTYR